MHYRDPAVLILNITVIVILSFLIIPTLFNHRERLMVRISYSIIFLVVIVNCISNLIIFYFEKYELLGFHFIFMFVPFLFGPAIYFYVMGFNGEINKKVWPHLIIPGIAFLYGLTYFFKPDGEKAQIISDIAKGNHLPYNLINTAVMSVPMYYFVVSKLWIRNLKLNENDSLYKQQIIKKKWSNEFVNYIMFSVFSFLVITIIATFIFEVPSTYLDLIGMPIYFPFLYSIIAVRSNMISKDLEIQYALSKAENEARLQEQRSSISRDLHDNIGAYANSLLLKIDHLSRDIDKKKPEQIKDLKENAEQILSLLRQTIWVLKNDEVSAESFFDHLKQYAMKCFDNTQMKVNFEENISNNRILTSAQASNIFRIAQEALQNIMKHSDAKNIIISLSSGEHFELCIADDGKGLDYENAVNGFGLQNMDERAQQIKMKTSVESSEGQGTKVFVTDNYA